MSLTKAIFCVCILAWFAPLLDASPTNIRRFPWEDKPKPSIRRGHHHHIVKVLLEHKAEQFCSTFLHIASTTCETVTPTTTTTTSETWFPETTTTTTTTMTSTVDPVMTTVSSTVTQVISITTIDGTVTATATDAIITTTTTTDTTTAFEYTAPVRRDVDVPHWLPFPSSAISSACSRIVLPRTRSITTTTITTLTEATATSLTTDVMTNTFSDTETDFITTVTTSTTTTATQFAVATACSVVMPVGAAIPGANGTTTQPSGIADSDQCCEFCWSTVGCGFWYYTGSQCYLLEYALGPNADDQCPSGNGEYFYTPDNGAGGVGSAGPCLSQLTEI